MSPAWCSRAFQPVIVLFVCCAPFAAAPQLALAQDFRASDRSEQQPSIAIGDADLYPSLRLDYIQDSNIGLTPDREDEGTALVVRPGFNFVAQRRSLALTTSYRGDYAFSDSDVLEDQEHRLALGVEAEFGRRRRGSALLTVSRLTDDFGVDVTEGITESLSERIAFNRTLFNARFAYGARNARGNVGAGLRLEDRSYVNLPELNEGRDFVRVEPSVSFSYRLSGDTRAAIDLRFVTLDFDNDANDRDQIGLLVGLDFSPTGKLQGGFRVGLQDVSYDLDEVGGNSILRLEADIEWRPRSFALLALGVVRETDDVSSVNVDAAEQSVRTIVDLAWNHRWSTRVASRTYVALNAVDRACPDRPTAVTSTGLELNLDVRRWLQFGTSVSAASRSADSCPGGRSGSALEYERLQLGAHVRVTL